MPFEPADIAFGAVVLVPFPFTDQATSKRRPAVVVNSVLSSIGHVNFGKFWLCDCDPLAFAKVEIARANGAVTPFRETCRSSFRPLELVR